MDSLYGQTPIASMLQYGNAGASMPVGLNSFTEDPVIAAAKHAMQFNDDVYRPGIQSLTPAPMQAFNQQFAQQTPQQAIAPFIQNTYAQETPVWMQHYQQQYNQQIPAWMQQIHQQWQQPQQTQFAQQSQQPSYNQTAYDPVIAAARNAMNYQDYYTPIGQTIQNQNYLQTNADQTMPAAQSRYVQGAQGITSAA